MPFSYEVTIKHDPQGKVSNPLWQAVQVGYPISSDCRAGRCGECQIGVTQGQTRYVITPEFVAPTARVLACCCVPETNLSLTTR